MSNPFLMDSSHVFQGTPAFVGFDVEKQDGKYTAVANALVDAMDAEMLKDLLEGRVDLTQKNAKDVSQKYVANKHSVLALENGVQGALGVDGLVFFQAGAGENAPPNVTLSVDEKRFFKVSELCSEDVKQFHQKTGRARCACVKNTVTGNTRREVMWEKPRPALDRFLDMGPKQWPANFTLFITLLLRGCWF